MLSKEELLKPRYKVMSDWPGRKDFVVGEVVTLDKDFTPEYKKYEIEDCQGKRVYITSFFEMFPLQFKPLPWYAEREVSEMPEYVKSVEGIVYRTGWIQGVITENGQQPMKMKLGNGKVDWQVIPNIMSFYEPATHEQYIQYTQTKQANE